MKILLICLLSLFSYADTQIKIFHNEESGQPIRSVIHPSDPTTSKVTEKDFYSIINNSFSLYDHLQGNDGKIIEIGIQDWKTPYLSAWAHDNGKSLTVNYWGGYARINGTTLLSFSLTACHEIGHLVGGAPTHTKKAAQPMMSAEGQADYFAASECLKKFLLQYPIDEEIHLNPKMAAMCHEKIMNSPVSINRELNVQLCYQVMQAGLDISRVFAHLARVDIPDPLKPSPLKVEETNYDGYPNVQCRLDTYIQGALSIYPPDLENKELRPSCWYKK